MYHVSAQGVDKRMINVHYYYYHHYYYLLTFLCHSSVPFQFYAT